jgi:ribosomal protein S5
MKKRLFKLSVLQKLLRWKKMTFRAICIIGDNKRKVGVGVGRAEDVNLAN